MTIRKKRIFHKIGPKNKHDSLFCREGTVKNIMGQEVDVEEELSLIEEIEETIKRQKENIGSHGSITRANIDRNEKLARKVLEEAGLPTHDDHLHPLPDDPNQFVRLIDHQLIGIDPTPEYHAAHAIHYARQLKHFLGVKRNFNNGDLDSVAELSLQMQYNTDCLLVHNWEDCARVGEEVIKGNKKNFREERSEWVKGSHTNAI